MITRISYLLLVLGLSCWGYAQDTHFSAYANHPTTVNPALTGQISGGYGWRAFASQRQQYAPQLGASNAFLTSTAALERSFCVIPGSRNFAAFGLSAVYDQRGALPLRRQEGHLTGAFHFYLGRAKKKRYQLNYLTVGAEVGFIGHRLNYQDRTFDEQFTDPSLLPELTGSRSDHALDLGVGLVFTHTTSDERGTVYQLGGAYRHVNRPAWSLLGEPNGDDGRLINGHFVVHANLQEPLTNKLGVNVQLVYRHQAPHAQLMSRGELLIDGGELHQLILGGGLRMARGEGGFTHSAYIISVGGWFTERFQLRLNYDGPLQGVQYSPQGLELMMTYLFGKTKCVNCYFPG